MENKLLRDKPQGTGNRLPSAASGRVFDPSQNEPLWSRCVHLSAGTCPQLMLESQALTGAGGPRPELNQDMALARLAQACRQCPLAPVEEKT